MPPISSARAAQLRSLIRTCLEARMGAIPDLEAMMREALAVMNYDDWDVVVGSILQTIDEAGCVIVERSRGGPGG